MEAINYDLEDLHRVQLAILKKLISVCEERGFSYFLAFGSLLGAARDHKIIPWDDSIDVVMPYQDYERLISLPQEMWGGNLFLQTYESDPQYPRAYAKLRDSSTTLIKAEYVSYDINQGIYINIVPLIKLADDSGCRRSQQRDAKLFKALTENRPCRPSEWLLRLYSSLLLALPTSKKRLIRDRLMKKILQYEESDAKDCFALAGDVSLDLTLSCAWFESVIDWDFEGMKVRIPKGWHEWLTLRYGDYMEVPISDLQGDKIAGFVTLNTQRPYIEYKGKTYCN